MAGEPGKRTSRQPLQFGKYTVLSHIGAGGMAAVYKAVDDKTGRQVALKILPPDLADKPNLLRRFEREARTAARMHHQNLVEVYELGEANDTHFIAMEFVEGIDLQQRIAGQGALDVDEALDILTQSARGLDHAHRHGVVHRDIKPSNLLITQRDGQRLVKLTDLGLALDQLSKDDSRVTRPGTTLGTLDYMAPEQARGGHLADIRSDLYALGCTFYHMLTGRPPFPEGGIGEKIYKHQNVRPADPREERPELEEPVLVILGRLLQKRPEDRYQTPAELLLDLERLQHLQTSQPPETLAALALGTPLEPKRKSASARTTERDGRKAKRSQSEGAWAEQEDGEPEESEAWESVPWVDRLKQLLVREWRLVIAALVALLFALLLYWIT